MNAVGWKVLRKLNWGGEAKRSGCRRTSPAAATNGNIRRVFQGIDTMVGAIGVKSQREEGVAMTTEVARKTWRNISVALNRKRQVNWAAVRRLEQFLPKGAEWVPHTRRYMLR